jgi:hypothetical protein
MRASLSVRAVVNHPPRAAYPRAGRTARSRRDAG